MHCHKQVSKQPLQRSGAKLVAFGGHRLNTCGKIIILCEHKGKNFPIEFQRVDQDVPRCAWTNYINTVVFGAVH